MRGFLARVGGDQGPLGGGWNGPVDLATGEAEGAELPELTAVAEPT